MLDALGLRSGQGASAFCWAESDPDVRALLRAYPDAAMLRRIAEIIRGWAGEEPRALWERLRAERKARGPAVDAEGAAEWTWLVGHGDSSVPPRLASPYLNPDGNADGSWKAPPREWLADRCHRLAEYAQIQSSNRLVNMAGPDLMNTGNGGTRFGGEFATPAGDVAARFEEVALGVGEWTYLAANAFRAGFPDSGIFVNVAGSVDPSDYQRASPGSTAGTMTGLADGKGWPPTLILPTIPTAADVAAWLGTPGDLEGVVVYSDPPYENTTGYRDLLPRADVVRHALDFATLGAVVCVSEAEALPELVAAGWSAAEISAGRRGQRRTFSKQQHEWLTMNREPVHRVAVQTSMFGGAA